MLRTIALLPLATFVLTSPAAAQCGNSTSNVPLIDLGAGLYQGFEGGLYPGGVNTPPQAHLDAALTVADTIIPLDAAGAPDPVDGKVVLISIGMSNTAHSFSVFERQEDLNPTRDPRLVILNAAQGGQSATVIKNPGAPYWDIVAGRLAALGTTADQVQVIWLKEAIQGPANDFPGHANLLRDELEEIVQNFLPMFPNLKLCYLSGRTYGGYNNGNPEPQAYENSFAVRWLIEDQIEGQAQLNFDTNAGPVMAPLLLWGPYLWADGELPRSDGLFWCACDFENCFNTHPSPPGEQKVGDLLSDFFNNDPTAESWWRNPGLRSLESVEAVADSHVVEASPDQNFGTEIQMISAGGNQAARSFIRFDLTGIERPVRYAKLSLRVPEGPAGTADMAVAVAPDSSWGEETLTWNNAPPFGATFVVISRASRDGTRSADVTQAVNDDLDGVLTLILTNAAPINAISGVHTRESGQPPRLILQVGQETGLAFCFGDGGDQMGCANCPCGNNAPQGSVGGCLNSSGSSARLMSSGASEIANDTLHFDVLGADPGAFGLLVSGNTQLPANPAAACPAGSGITSMSFEGLRCVGAGIIRHGARTTDSNGDIGITTNGWGAPHPPPAGLLSQMAAVPGQTRHLQVIYRAIPNGACATGLNTTNGVTIQIKP